jgi:hypothetical protein
MYDRELLSDVDWEAMEGIAPSLLEFRKRELKRDGTNKDLHMLISIIDALKIDENTLPDALEIENDVPLAKRQVEWLEKTGQLELIMRGTRIRP